METLSSIVRPWKRENALKFFQIGQGHALAYLPSNVGRHYNALNVSYSPAKVGEGKLECFVPGTFFKG